MEEPSLCLEGTLPLDSAPLGPRLQADARDGHAGPGRVERSLFLIRTPFPNGEAETLIQPYQIAACPSPCRQPIAVEQQRFLGSPSPSLCMATQT